MKEGEGLYYPCKENKGADQLRSYCVKGSSPMCDEAFKCDGVSKFKCIVEVMKSFKTGNIKMNLFCNEFLKSLLLSMFSFKSFSLQLLSALTTCLDC